VIEQLGSGMADQITANRCNRNKNGNKKEQIQLLLYPHLSKNIHKPLPCHILQSFNPCDVSPLLYYNAICQERIEYWEKIQIVI